MRLFVTCEVMVLWLDRNMYIIILEIDYFNDLLLIMNYVRCGCINTHTHTRLMALFLDYPGEPVPER